MLLVMLLVVFELKNLHFFSFFSWFELTLSSYTKKHLQPSQDDLSITKKIKAACETVDIVLHDHLIVTSIGYYSLADNGLLW